MESLHCSFSRRAPVIAGEASAILSVSATIANVCRVSTSAVSFGSYDPIGVNALVPLNASGAVAIACTKGSAATVGLVRAPTPAVPRAG